MRHKAVPEPSHLDAQEYHELTALSDTQPSAKTPSRARDAHLYAPLRLCCLTTLVLSGVQGSECCLAFLVVSGAQRLETLQVDCNGFKSPAFTKSFVLLSHVR